MNTNRLVGGLLGLVGLGTSYFAQAQTTSATSSRPATYLSVFTLPGTPPEAARYAVAHDSLTRLLSTAYANSETLTLSFRAVRSNFGSIHRRVKSYSDTELKQLVKREVVKQRFGMQVKKVSYYDPNGRLFLKERYENHQLIWLTLKQYQEPFNSPLVTWLFVRGNYLKRTNNNTANGEKGRKISNFFSPLPATE